MSEKTDPRRMVFRVQQQGEVWLVRLGEDTWGQYPARRQALKIAAFAARDAQRPRVSRKGVGQFPAVLPSIIQVTGFSAPASHFEHTRMSTTIMGTHSPD